MKNLFKNLMLVAVAAMAFTACQNDNNEVNEVNRVTRYEFTANIADDTRSGFAEKEEGATAYKSEWYGNETLKIFVTDYSNYNVETTASINAEGNFALELTDAPESFFITVVSPAESWVSEYTANIPAEQTPLANSVDPKAHLLQAQARPVSGGVADIDMTHMAAYGKMTVKGVDFAIDHVVVDLKGSFYGYDREYSYTINATNVENNTFWFATEPIDVAEFTVTAYDAEGNAVAKTVDVAAAGKTMSFQYGRVGTFSVSGLEAYVEPEEPEEPKALVFTSAKWVNTSTSDKFVQFYTEDGGTLQLNFYNCNYSDLLDARTYGFANSGDIYPGGRYSWYENTAAGIDTEIVGGSVMVSVVNGQYYIEFSNMADYDGVVIEAATFTGLISGLQVPDMRTALATPNVTSSVDGKMITISWDAVEGAESYKVYCATTSAIAEVNTTETTVTIEAPEYSKQYEFMVTAIAADTDPDYKSSEAKTIKVTTDKDPNGPIADYMWDETFVWNNSGYFELRDSSYSTSYWYIYLNAADRPGNNSIKPGVYTATNTTSPGEGEFSVKISASGSAPFWGIYASYLSNAHTLEVKVVDGKYQIAFTYSNASHGYIGLPDGFVLPSDGGDSGEGGDEPVDPTPTPDPEPDPEPDPDQPGEGGTQSYEVTAGSTDWNWLQMTFTAGSKTLTGRLKYPKASQASGEYTLVAGSSSTNYTFHTIAVDGVAATSVSGTISLQINTNNGQFFDITFNDIVVDGMTFTGFAKVSLP